MKRMIISLILGFFTISAIMPEMLLAAVDHNSKEHKKSWSMKDKKKNKMAKKNKSKKDSKGYRTSK